MCTKCGAAVALDLKKYLGRNEIRFICELNIVYILRQSCLKEFQQQQIQHSTNHY